MTTRNRNRWEIQALSLAPNHLAPIGAPVLMDASANRFDYEHDYDYDYGHEHEHGSS